MSGIIRPTRRTLLRTASLAGLAAVVPGPGPARGQGGGHDGAKGQRPGGEGGRAAHGRIIPRDGVRRKLGW